MYSLAFISCTLFFADAQAAMPDATVPLEQLFGYGTEHGDQQLHNDTGSKFSAVVLDPPFKIFGEERNNATVVNNGYIEFRSGLFIIQARREIGSAFPAFQIIYLKWVLVATWYRVVHYIWYDDESTYQTILTTDGIRSFAIFYYHNSGRHTYPQVGFQLRNNYYWNTGSNTDNHTNIRTPGKWIFRIDLPVIYEPNSLCHMPLHPENGFCITNEFIPGSSAQCGCHVDPIFLLTLKCLRLTDNKTVDWLGDLLTCPPIQTPIQSTGLPCPPQFLCPSCPECIPTNRPTIHATTQTTPLFSLPSQSSLTLLDSRSNIKLCPRPPVPFNGICEKMDYLPGSFAKCTCLPNYRNIKLCPRPPVPFNGICEKMDYLPGSFAKCTCLPNYRNVRPNSRLYCVFDDDGSVFWTGRMPDCVESSR